MKDGTRNSRKSARLVTAFLPLIALTALGADESNLNGELALVDEFLPGTFDNYEQIYWEEEGNTPKELRHRRSTATTIRVDLPQFGEHVFYTHAYWDGNPARREYRNLYILYADQETNAVRMRLLIIPQPERLDNALTDQSVLKSLTPASLAPMEMVPGCNTVWRLRGVQFTTEFAGTTCDRKIPPSTSPVTLTSNSTIGRNEFLYLTTGVDGAGKLVFGPPDFIPSKELRARNFTCSVDRESGGRETVQLHDRGGTASLVESQTAPALSVRLRQFTPPGSVHSEGLALIVLPEDGREKVDSRHRITTPHAWAPSTATLISYAGKSVDIRCALAKSAQ